MIPSQPLFLKYSMIPCHCASPAVSSSSKFLIFNSAILNIVYRCLLLTVLTRLFRCFFFSFIRIGSLSTPRTTARHVNNLSSRYAFGPTLVKRAVFPISLAPCVGSGKYSRPSVLPMIGGGGVEEISGVFDASWVPARSVQSRLPSVVIRSNLMMSPGITPCIRNGNRTVSPCVMRYGLPCM